MITTTPHTATRPQIHIPKPKRRRRRRELVPMRRVNRMQRAIEAIEAVQSRFPDFADHFELSIRSLRTEGGRSRVGDTVLVIRAIEQGGAWTVSDIMDWTGLSRRKVKRELGELVAQGLVKKSKESPRGKGRPRHIYRVTANGPKTKVS